jgi:hypothetical protein
VDRTSRFFSRAPGGLRRQTDRGNLIINGDAEAGPGSAGSDQALVKQVPDWKTIRGFTVMQYDGS